MVQIHVRAPLSKPLCLSSYRAGFVNPYSSVQVRPGAPFSQGRDVTASISACDADCAGANPVALTISIKASRLCRWLAPVAKILKYTRALYGFDIVILKGMKAILRALQPFAGHGDFGVLKKFVKG